MDYGSDSYTTVTAVQTYLDRPLDANEQAILAYVIPSASRWIDRVLNSNFDNLNQLNGKTARHFKGGLNSVNITPCQQIALVQALNPYDNSIWYTYSSPLEYIAEPYDLPVKNYITLRRNEFTGNDLRWPGDDIGLLITALFTEYDYAHNCIPSDIVMLCNHLSAVWLQNNQNADVWVKEAVEGHLVSKSMTHEFDLLVGDPMVNRIIQSREQIWLD